MKRLMGSFLTILAIVFSSAAFAQHKTNSTYCYNHPEECGKGRAAAPASQGGSVAPFNAHLANLLPKDLVYIDRTKPTYPCNENGVRVSTTFGNCSDVVSQGSGQRYVLRFSKNGDSSFIVQGGNPVKYAAFNGGTDSSGVAYLSSEARQYAESHGYRHDPRSNTMVAIGTAPTVTAQAPNDCTGKVMLEKIKCEALNNQTLRQSGAQPGTSTADAGPCAGKSNLEKQLCVLEQGAKTGVIRP